MKQMIFILALYTHTHLCYNCYSAHTYWPWAGGEEGRQGVANTRGSSLLRGVHGVMAIIIVTSFSYGVKIV